ncbi:MAG: tetratricopeptide repeat protein [Rhodocyclaceae bacterium]|nr:tetratricopeptide repeat protein [Rhodocyclaceae bacterium]
MSLWLSVGAFVFVALVFLLVPLWREKSALAGRHNERRWPVIGLLGALPAVTVGLYLYLGVPTILKEQALMQAQASYDTDAMIKALEDKLKAQPDDAEGWYALGRAYIALQRLDDAELALAKSARLAPKDAKMLAQYAEAIALKTGSLEGRPLELVMQALELDYEEEKALELAGLAAYQQEKWAESLHFWRRLMKKLPKDSEFYEEIGRAVKIAEGKVVEASGLGDRAKLASPEKQKRPH